MNNNWRVNAYFQMVSNTNTTGINTIIARTVTANQPLASCGPCFVANRSDVGWRCGLGILLLQSDAKPLILALLCSDEGFLVPNSGGFATRMRRM